MILGGLRRQIRDIHVIESPYLKRIVIQIKVIQVIILIFHFHQGIVHFLDTICIFVVQYLHIKWIYAPASPLHLLPGPSSISMGLVLGHVAQRSHQQLSRPLNNSIPTPNPLHAPPSLHTPSTLLSSGVSAAATTTTLNCTLDIDGLHFGAGRGALIGNSGLVRSVCAEWNV